MQPFTLTRPQILDWFVSALRHDAARLDSYELHRSADVLRDAALDLARDARALRGERLGPEWLSPAETCRELLAAAREAARAWRDFTAEPSSLRDPNAGIASAGRAPAFGEANARAARALDALVTFAARLDALEKGGARG